MQFPPILFDDETMLVVDKPAGLPVAAFSGRNDERSLNALVQARYGREVKSAHKMDPDAGGPVVYAKSKPALDFLSGQFQSKTVEVVWSALVVVPAVAEAARPAKVVRDEQGLPPVECLLDWPILEDSAGNGLWRIGRRQEGRAAITTVRRLELYGRFALLECIAPTAPAHQLRLHLATAGLPVLNDAAYGPAGVELRLSDLKRGYKGRADERALIRDLALHAVKMTVRHVETREPTVIESPLPKDFEISLKNLRKFSLRA